MEFFFLKTSNAVQKKDERATLTSVVRSRQNAVDRIWRTSTNLAGFFYLFLGSSKFDSEFISDT
jgi:hypothetical protein